MPLSDNALDEMVARERERGAPPLTDWDSLALRLRAEGLIREPIVSRFASRRWMQMAAGVTLAIGGAAFGRMSAGAPVLVSSRSIRDTTISLEEALAGRVPGLPRIAGEEGAVA